MALAFTFAGLGVLTDVFGDEGGGVVLLWVCAMARPTMAKDAPSMMDFFISI